MNSLHPKTAAVCQLFGAQVQSSPGFVVIALPAFSLDGRALAPLLLTPAFPGPAELEAFCDRHWVDFLSWDITLRDEGVMGRPFWQGAERLAS